MPEQLFTCTPPATGHYDEVFQPDGALRPHWRNVAATLQAWPESQLNSRLDHIARQIFDNGITYNVYADPKGVTRPWELDMLPHIIPHDEWQVIESGIIQRATLMNRILTDVYGSQTLLRDGLIPPALVHGHAGFMRPAQSIRPPDDIWLHLYAVDLVRTSDNRWWAIGDRAQAPSGAGYALENRTVISRAFPELFRDLRVQRLAAFFRTLQQSLEHWAPADPDAGTPRIVVLTPGPYNETWFEHAYLARHLGFPLVERQDLMVSDGKVWLKTLNGLQRVHAILRRQDDDFCDPLEARPDSTLGIPGLFQAARTGNVLIANAPGASLIETGALYGFLPGLCDKLLGEPLRLPSVASWWCGEPAALDNVLTQFPAMIIKGAFPQLRIETRIVANLPPAQQKQLRADLCARPWNYVAQEHLKLAHAPVLSRTPEWHMENRVVCLRVFAVATPQGYQVMPGGLTRVAARSDLQIVSMQRGGGSKDTWVQEAEMPPSQATASARHTTHSTEPSPPGEVLSTRMIENLFWLGRYTERSENVARLLRATFTRLVDEDENSPLQQSALLRLCQDYGLLPPGQEQDETPEQIQQSLLEALFNPACACGLAGNLNQLMRIGSHLRERLSLDNWRILNRFSQELERQYRNQSQTHNLGDALAFLDLALGYMAALSGYALDGMTRDIGWKFLSIGRRLERLQHLAHMMERVLSDDDTAHANLTWWLELCDSIITWRTRYLRQPTLPGVLSLLLTSEDNPRSVRYLLQGMADYLHQLTRQFGEFTDPALFTLADELAHWRPGLADDNAERTALLARVHRLKNALSALSDQITLRFFSHVAEHYAGNE